MIRLLAPRELIYRLRDPFIKKFRSGLGNDILKKNGGRTQTTPDQFQSNVDELLPSGRS